MRSRNNHTVPAEEAAATAAAAAAATAAAAALPYGLLIQSLSHYHSQYKHALHLS